MSSVPTASPDIGVLLDGRYRVEELVARGGMATVYRGHDERLDRTVALKVMHPHLAADPQFRARFTREARSAARLSHPHVVSVFDHGEDADRAYLAMELIDGETLRTALGREGALTVRRAADVAVAVLEALEAAHHAGIVHRDIKPENILLAGDGRVKVADFGLARAVGASTASATGALLGTVAYVSPEVVTRGHCDERSDLYSFGVVLYEMLTGRQPYTGEQPVHVAFQHVHEDIPAPSATTPSVPRSLDGIVTWCCARTPDSRPRTAREVLAALSEVRVAMSDAVADAAPVHAMPASTQDIPHLTSPLEESALRRDAPSRAFPTAAGGGAPPSSIPGTSTGTDTGTAPAGSASADRDRDPRVGPAGGPSPQAPDHAGAREEARVVALRRPPARTGRHLPPTARTRRSPAVRAIGAATVLALVGGIGWSGLRWYETEGPGGDRSVPAVAGRPLADAEASLAAQDLDVRTSETFSDTVPAGEVVGAAPGPGRTVKRGDTVVLLVSRGEQTFPVPDVRGQPVEEARTAVEQASLTLLEHDPAYDEKVPRGSVISQSAGAEELPAGGEVRVVLSRGPRPVAIPDTRGRTAAEATAALREQGFLVRTSESFSPTVPQGAVVSQDPPNGSARRGATIGIAISKGPEMAAVPDVFRRSEADATAALRAAGFDVSVVHDKGKPVFGQVYAQSPGGGAQAAKGSTVTIRVF